MTIAIIGGLIIYGTGIKTESLSELVVTIIRIPIIIFRMFIGVNELNLIDTRSVFICTGFGRISFWLIHVLAFYSMASAAMNTIGAQAVRYLRLFFSWRGDLILIFGINQNSIVFGRDCCTKKKATVVFITDGASSDIVADLNQLGMLVFTSQKAVNADPSFLRHLRVKNRKIEVYALDEDYSLNFNFAVKLKKSLESLKVPAENTCITLPGREISAAPELQVTEENYGFGFVHVFSGNNLMARALVQMCPPWDVMQFDENGCAKESFSCVVVGFGRRGQAILKHLVMNGQFTGSDFHAAVFSLDIDSNSGLIKTESQEIFQKYDIELFDFDGRSQLFCEYIKDNLANLKMIVVCTGKSDEVNREITEDVITLLEDFHAVNIRVAQCDKSTITLWQSENNVAVCNHVYQYAYLSPKDSDRKAIILNGVYNTEEHSDWEKWVACDSFSRSSSRASADYLPAFVRASGYPKEEILLDGWKPNQNLLENLARMEHLRWMAFHFVIGYKPMPKEQFDRLVAENLGKNKVEKSNITKDKYSRTHACLIPWDELDDLSRKVSEITGQKVDYKQYDRNNILAIPQLLKAEENQGGKP